MLVGRVILAAVVLFLWWRGAPPYGEAPVWLGWGVAWPAITALTLFAGRFARMALTATLLGDGLLLGAAGWALGDLAGRMGVLIVLHAVAVTLFASFRTGVRIAFWHSLVAMLLIDAVGLGLLPDTGGWTWSASWPYFAVLWLAVSSAAVYAARNERTLRRRHDEEAVRQFGVAVAEAPGPVAVTTALAEFGRRELAGRRAAVLAYGEGFGLGVVADGVTHVDRPGPENEPAFARDEPDYRLLSRLDDRTGKWFASVLPGARNVVVMPWATGALVVEVGAERVERGAVENVVRAVRMVAETAR
ncbi:hypothetical protein KOI35_22775 [Actinoplanes bogorensis]|uniref:Uncharacterized protein n=1 Tax=Paractinoplanes bogorensis TaxID=1610840 RepID=A0ABS5YSN9_9ACTN|nr:hypothetical protein [Actinoplanes bogorensis]MBU2666331.1 hypothetical protein [Actinoplanes bogorensis]